MLQIKSLVNKFKTRFIASIKICHDLLKSAVPSSHVLGLTRTEVSVRSCRVDQPLAGRANPPYHQPSGQPAPARPATPAQVRPTELSRTDDGGNTAVKQDTMAQHSAYSSYIHREFALRQSVGRVFSRAGSTARRAACVFIVRRVDFSTCPSPLACSRLDARTPPPALPTLPPPPQ